MIGPEQISDIISLYEKHGWILSRVLLSESLDNELSDGDVSDLFADIAPENSEVDALWFKRPRHDGRIAWEIRHLSTRPYALCEAYPEDSLMADVLHEMTLMENRLKELASS